MAFQEFEQNHIFDELIAHIEAQLPHFVSSNTFSRIMIVKKNETQHSTALALYMMKNQNRFSFIPEVAQVGTHKIDIAVYDKLSDEMLFTIEAKVLPTPLGTKRNPRAETEYVYSQDKSGAGIQRYKMGYHGVNDALVELAENGIVAYIKEGEFEKWLAKINKWVLDADWDEKEQLQTVYFNPIGKLRSVHKRTSGTEVILHHYWVKVQ